MSGAPRIKVCGITSLDDAQLAVEAGAWAVGMVFWEGSPRRCELPEAQLVARRLKRLVEVCGVFVNAPLDELTALVDALGLTLVQLHGDEGPAYADEVRRRTGAKVIKAARVRSGADLQALGRYHVDFHLLDAHHPSLRGGTGETWDWELVAHRRSATPLILSGGLRADNVAKAIEVVRPWAVDVASGVEAAPGRKDSAKVEAFVAAVRAVHDEPTAARGEEALEAAP